MDTMRQKAIQYYRKVARQLPQYAPTRMAELAPGVVAVEDAAGECDALFDGERWDYTNPEIWESDPETKSLALTGAGLKVLEGFGVAMRVRSIETMMLFAQSQLSPKRQTAWHSVPQFFTF